MSVVTWSKHYQHVWQERSADPDVPKWLRVVSLAYGMHRANGHAPMGPGRVALALSMPDPKTGALVPDYNAGRSLRSAVKYGWLSDRSTLRCLVVPPHAVGGGLGDPSASCPIHGSP